jgi:hypothetical protein
MRTTCVAYRVWSSNRFAAPVVTMGDGAGSDEADIGDAFGQLAVGHLARGGGVDAAPTPTSPTGGRAAPA